MTQGGSQNFLVMFFLPRSLESPVLLITLCMYILFMLYSTYMYILFFLAVERYWFRQLYHRLESLERMSKDLHSVLISVCGLDFI